MDVVIQHFGEHPHAKDFEQRVEASLKLLQEKVNKLMATAQQMKTQLDDIATEATRIANEEAAQVVELKRLQQLIIDGDGLKPEDLDPLVTHAQGIVTAMKAIGGTPTQPVGPGLPVDPNPPVPATGQ